MDYTVLIAEDDQDIVELLTLYFESNGFQVLAAEDGLAALEMLEKKSISILLVDLMMPKMNGYELIKEIRKDKNLPIIIISAKNMNMDKVLGLDIGADAYITKPFNPLEVVAYVKAILRRYYQLGTDMQQEKSPFLTLGELSFDQEKYILRKNDKIIPLTSTELKIVAKMLRCPGKVFTKAQLYECINGEFYESDDNTMMVHISNIRSKIEADPTNPVYIQTVRGLGYKIEETKKKS